MILFKITPLMFPDPLLPLLPQLKRYKKIRKGRKKKKKSKTPKICPMISTNMPEQKKFLNDENKKNKKRSLIMNS